MLFGAVNRFGVEAEPIEVHDRWIYGNLRFWIGSKAIGDYEDTSDLATSARWGRIFLNASAQRTRDDLDHIPPPDVYEQLYGRFVQSFNAQLAKPWPGHWDRDPYILDDVGESSLRDKVAIVVVRKKDGSDRILVHSYDDGHTSETIVPQGECDRAIEAYCVWIESMQNSESA